MQIEQKRAVNPQAYKARAVTHQESRTIRARPALASSRLVPGARSATRCPGGHVMWQVAEVQKSMIDGGEKDAQESAPKRIPPRWTRGQVGKLWIPDTTKVEAEMQGV